MSSASVILANGVEIDAAGIGFLVPTNQIPVSTSLGIEDDALILGIPGPRGQDGKQGKSGLSIASARIDANSSLVLLFSDGSEVNVGQVIGPRGIPGQNGRSIRTTDLRDGRLTLILDDETVIDVGRVTGQQGLRGERGPGVTDAKISDAGYLVLTFADGSSMSAGFVLGPIGPKGNTGDTGPIGPIGPQPWKNTVQAWGQGTTYSANAPADVVTYLGSTYLCKVDHIAGATFESSNWTLIASRGTDGTGTMNGPISSTDGNVVVFNGVNGMLTRDSGVRFGSSSNNGLQLDSKGAVPDAVAGRLNAAMYYFMNQ